MRLFLKSDFSIGVTQNEGIIWLFRAETPSKELTETKLLYQLTLMTLKETKENGFIHLKAVS